MDETNKTPLALHTIAPLYITWGRKFSEADCYKNPEF